MILTKKDYKNLLNYYNIKTKKKTSYKNLKNIGEKILAKKLCKCIKTVDKINENKSIPICTYSIFKNKNLNFQKFTCKKNKKIYGLKKTLKKTLKNSLKLNKK